MAKLESTFKNMVISLVSIAVVAAAALAGVYTLTKDKIEQQKAEKDQSAILAVLPNNGVGAVIAPADTLDAKKDLIVYRAYTDSTFADSTFIGAAVKISANGFGGKFKMMIGFDKNNRIVNYTILEHQETPGLGDKMGKWFCNPAKEKSCVIGRQAGNLKVSKDAGGDVDAITAATISSRAFLEAVNGAYNAYATGDADAATSASQKNNTVQPAPEEHKCCGHCKEHHGEGHQCQGHAEEPAGEHKCCGHCKHHQENNNLEEMEEDHE